MPATRITVALNSKQSQITPLLLPITANLEPSASDSCRAFVIKNAQAKLRLKKASRVYVAGTGQELLEEEDWRNVLREDVVLLVSAGEEYVGLRKEEGAGAKSSGNHPDGNPDRSISILAQTAPVDPLALTQVETTAHTLPGIVHAVAQPDLHPGTKFPIGAVFVSKGWIHPPLIGGDIGCGMAWYKTRLSGGQAEGDKGRRVAEKLRGLEGVWRTREDRERWLTDGSGGQESSMSAGEEWDRSLGTIGAGNHFAELQVVEAFTSPDFDDEAEREDHMLREGDVVLLVHSGSRGYGGDILKRYTAGGSVSIHESDPKAIEYMKEHDKACGWAKKSRDLIALRFLACLEPGDDSWELGVNDRLQTSAEAISTTKAHLQQRKVVDIWHNNVEKIPWPPKPPCPSTSNDLSPATSTLNIVSDGAQTPVYIHRKGAAPTHNPTTSLPLSILPLPGSRGTPTIILHPTFSESTGWGVKNGLSLAHGAGRAMSRAKAAAWVAQKYKGRANDLLRGGEAGKANAAGNKPTSSLSSSSGGATGTRKVGGEKVHGGTWVVCEEKRLVWEEAPEAYKDVYAVCEDLVREGVAVAVGWCRARVSYKVRDE